MLIQGDFDLNSPQRYADSTKEVLKQTILNQEIIFRKQVCGQSSNLSVDVRFICP